MMNSYVYSISKIGQLEQSIVESELPFGFFTALDTTSLSEYFPTLSEKMGKDLPVEVRYKVLELGNFKSYEGQQ